VTNTDPTNTMSTPSAPTDPRPAVTLPASLEARSMLLVDDDETFRERLARALRDRGFDVRTASNFSEGVRLAEEDSPEYAVIDLRMPGKGGMDLLRELKRVDAGTRTVILTGYGSIATAVEAVRLGAINFIPKPADADDVVAAFEKYERGDPMDGPAVTSTYRAPTLARMEWEHIQRVLSDCGGNISESARRLGIHRRSLQRKLQRHAPQEMGRS
jgi:two-component system response regulator RegA